MFVSERKRQQKIRGDTRRLQIGPSTGSTEEKSIQIPQAHNGACRGSDGVAEKMPKQVHSVVRGHYVADGQQTTGKDLFITWLAYSLNA